MNLIEATVFLSHLKTKIRRKSWKNKQVYKAVGEVWLLSPEDILAEDWEVV